MPNAVTIAAMVMNLIHEKACSDYQSFTRAWNQRATTSNQIRGAKATCLKLIFEMAPQEGVDLILACVLENGFENTPWDDHNLSCKKIYPTYKFPAKGKKWQARMVVTNESFVTFVKRQQRDHQKLSGGMKDVLIKKPDASDLIATTELALVALAAVSECQRMVPVPDAKMRSAIHIRLSICFQLQKDWAESDVPSGPLVWLPTCWQPI